MKSQNIIAIIATLVCTQAAAEGDNIGETGSGWQLPYQSTFWRYAAVTAGRSHSDFHCVLLALPCYAKDQSAFKLAAGGNFNRALGVEIAYVNLGDVALPYFGGSQRAQGADLSLVASTTVFDRIGLHARIGGIYGWTRTQVRVEDITCILGNVPEPECNPSRSDRGFGFSYGAGLSARVAPRVELRFDWDHYRFSFANDGDFAHLGSERDVDMWSAGLNLLF